MNIKLERRMKFQDLPTEVQVVAAQTLQTIILEDRCDKDPESPAVLAQDIKAGFEALYGEDEITNKLIVEIEPRIVGLDKLEALIELLQRRPGLVEGTGSTNGLQRS